jgi:uncharacterized protein (TIGR00730 family)
MKKIAVFGSARVAEDSEAYRQAQELGRRLVAAGFVVASGGYLGTMDGVSRGATEVGGQVIGVTSDVFNPRSPSAWITNEVRTADLHERLQTIIELADGYIALRGGIGTLTEVTLTWNLMQLGDISTRPFILLGENWRAIVDSWRIHSDMGQSILGYVSFASSVDEAMSLLDRWDFEGSAPVPSRPPA